GLNLWLNALGCPREVHPFPTRRSSDLDTSIRASVAWSHALATPAERVVLRRLSVFSGAFDSDAASAVCGEDAEQAIAGLAAKSLDRKSTRLNSSHRTISYAVLCLKKQN